MSPAIRRSIGHALLLTLLLFCYCNVVSAESRSVTVKDARPVAKAVEALETIFRWPITYEDPPYVHESEMVDVTAQVRRDQQNSKRVMIPREGSFSFTYDVPSWQSESVGIEASTALQAATAGAIAEVLRSYSAARGANMFTVIEDKGLFHVVPTQFIGASGGLEIAKPLLDTTISVLPKQRTGVDLVNEFCQSLTLATSQTVIPGSIPRKLLANHVTTITATNETARSVLSQFLGELSDDLSWQVFYDPGLRWYVLNIHVVPGTKK